jgi:hypothetical protein
MGYSQNCNTWLRTTTNGSNVTVGDLDVQGNTVTVEATFNCMALPGNSQGFFGHMISKHTNQFDDNYALWANGCAITTNTGGERIVTENCTIQLNKTYHVAMVYDGITLKFYRNGFLQGQANKTGTLILNNLLTTIGNSPTTDNPQNFQFNGYINEVRIWNVARTQAQIKAFMSTTIPNPTAQNGLLGYYTFNNLNNQAGTNFNGILNGAATINNTNPNCLFTADSCGITCPSDTTRIMNKCFNTNIPLTVRQGTTYSWSPATDLSAANIQNPICSANTNTNYTVTITNTATNCTYRDFVNLIVNPAPISNIRDTSICQGDTIRLIAPSGYSTYSWTPAINISNTSVNNPLLWPPITTNYIVTITNSFGCSIKDTVLITVNNCGCEDSCNWSKTGNTFVKPTNFIGSKNNADFKVRTSNIQRMVVTASGNIGLNTPTPSKTLDVNGEAVVRTLPAAAPNDKLVLANATGELKSLVPGTTNQYLSGNGTWQTLPPAGGGTVTAADQGVTLDGATVLLGDYCAKGGGAFKSDREVNMENFNLYFNSAYTGKVRIGNNIGKERACPDLQARLELDTRGLKAVNDYVSPQPSLSGLRFVDLTAYSPKVDNKYKGVLSLDEDGDVIWVNDCCGGGGITTAETKSILDRLDKLEAELKTVKNENTALKIS